MNKQRLFSKIEASIKTFDTSSIPSDRKVLLNPLVAYIKNKLETEQSIALNFICTHNSRRSHLSQVWAQAVGHMIGIKNLQCYSGGTEATALFPMAVEILRNSGFEINMLSVGENPIYGIKYAVNAHPIIGFSKTFDDPFNPKSGFGAIMTCSSADEGCPFVGGSDGRFSITYEDPKAFDNTPEQKEKYQERSLQIATELLYVFTKAIE